MDRVEIDPSDQNLRGVDRNNENGCQQPVDIGGKSGDFKEVQRERQRVEHQNGQQYQDRGFSIEFPDRF